MGTINNSVLISKGLLVKDVGWSKDTFDPFDIVLDTNNNEIYGQELECYADARHAFDEWRKTDIFAYTCRGNRLLLLGKTLWSVKKEQPQSAFSQLLSTVSDTFVAFWNKIETPRQEQAENQLIPLPEGSVAIDPSLITLLGGEMLLQNYCSCDYYLDVCEAASKNTQSPCRCDPDCKKKKNPCVADGHCDSWCPPSSDPDCFKPKFEPSAFLWDSPKPPGLSKNLDEPKPIDLTPQTTYKPKCIHVMEQDCGWQRFGYNAYTYKPEIEYYCKMVPRYRCF